MRVGTPALTADTDLQLALLRRSQRGNPASPCILAVVVPTLVELFVVGKKQKSGKQLVRNYGGNTQGMRYRVKNEEWRSAKTLGRQRVGHVAGPGSSTVGTEYSGLHGAPSLTKQVL